MTPVSALGERIVRASNVLDDAYREHNPVRVYALFSGGHDSLTAAKLAQEWGWDRDIEVWCAHINTQTGIPETSEFVRRVCRDQGWSLRELTPPVKYEALVKEYGFPGPAQHGFMYQRLKERCLRTLIREAKQATKAKPRDRVMFVTGVRSQESVRRMKHVDRIQRDGSIVWAAPIHDWSKIECGEYIEAMNMPRNQVVDLIHMSGECLCGAYAKPGEIKELEQWFPQVAQRIHDLEFEVQAKGLRADRWGHGGKLLNVHRGQMKIGPLCQDCELAA